MRKFAMGLLGAAALTTTILLVRHQRVAKGEPEVASTDETWAAAISLERIRELGL